MAAYEDMIQNTARDYAPWHVIPANNKGYARMVICSVESWPAQRIAKASSG